MLVKVDLFGAHFWPAPDKVQKWLAAIDSCIETSTLQPGQAAKLTGQLQWTCQSTFQRLPVTYQVSITSFLVHCAGSAERYCDP